MEGYKMPVSQPLDWILDNFLKETTVAFLPMDAERSDQ